MKTLASLILAVLLPGEVFATGFVSGTVSLVRIDQSGNGLLFFDHNLSGTPPSCIISNYQNALAFNANAAGGKAVHAMALAAKATGATIVVSGLGTCSIFGGFVEDWDTGLLQ